MMSKVKVEFVFIINQTETCLLVWWHPGKRWHEHNSGFYMERENLSFWCKGRNSSRRPARMRVPIQNTGAEQLVVAMKLCNKSGAKG